jgi:hypothetical protein
MKDLLQSLAVRIDEDASIDFHGGNVACESDAFSPPVFRTDELVLHAVLRQKIFNETTADGLFSRIIGNFQVITSHTTPKSGAHTKVAGPVPTRTDAGHILFGKMQPVKRKPPNGS